MKTKAIGEFQDTQSLTGLRAYAALSVFFIHSQGFGLRDVNFGFKFISKFFNSIVDFGKYGVIVFFVLSAYTIAMSFEREEQINYMQYLLRRLFRVVPMYYLVVIIAFFFGGIQEYFGLFNVTNSWFNLFSHLTFFNLFQVEYRNNLLGVEWSVPIELFYYLVLPLLYGFLRKNLMSGVHLFIFSLALSLMGTKFLSAHLYSQFNDISYHWSPVKYLFSFSFGLILHGFYKRFKNQIPLLSGIVLLELFLLLLCFIYSDLEHHEEFITLWTGAIIIIAQSRSNISKLLFENKVVIFFGTISYSFYLIHFPVLVIMRTLVSNSILVSVCSLLITIFVSYLTYRFIEKPFIRIGKNFFAVKKIATT